LVIVQVGGREDSNVYIRMKLKAAAGIGVEARHDQLPRCISQDALLAHVKALNEDTSIHGVIVQMPLDCDEEIEEETIVEALSPEKDVVNSIINGFWGFLPVVLVTGRPDFH